MALYDSFASGRSGLVRICRGSLAEPRPIALREHRESARGMGSSTRHQVARAGVAVKVLPGTRSTEKKSAVSRRRRPRSRATPTSSPFSVFGEHDALLVCPWCRGSSTRSYCSRQLAWPDPRERLSRRTCDWRHCASRCRAGYAQGRDLQRDIRPRICDRQTGHCCRLRLARRSPDGAAWAKRSHVALGTAKQRGQAGRRSDIYSPD